MSRRKRSGGSGSSGGGGGGASGKGNQGKGKKRGRRPVARGGPTKSQAYDPTPPERIRPTPDPGAVLRSLGEPPLSPDTAAELHLAAVYEEAVRAATALAAANGLLDLGDAEPTD
jgi:hypothetical protein